MPIDQSKTAKTRSIALGAAGIDLSFRVPDLPSELVLYVLPRFPSLA